MNVIEGPFQSSDSDLLRAYRQTGSQEALTAISRKYYGFILGVCRRELCNDEMAKDAAQEVLLDLMHRAHKLDAKDGLAPWLFRASLSRSRDLARSEARRRKREATYRPPVSANEEDRHAVNELVERLPDGERSAVLLRFVGGYSFEEIGKRFGLTADAARMRVNRGLDRLRQGLAAGGFALSAESALQFEPKEPPRLYMRAAKPRIPIHHAKWIAISGAVAGSLGTIALIGNPIVASNSATEPSGGGAIFARSAELEGDWLPFYAEVQLKFKDGGPSINSKYWRDGQQIRMIEFQERKEVHLRVDAKESLSMSVLRTAPLENEARIIKSTPNHRFVETDAWEAALLQLPVYIYATPPLSPWLTKDAIDGKQSREIVLKHPDGKRTYRLWLDPSKDNMVSRCEYVCRLDRNEFKNDTRVTEWQKVGKGWFPRKLDRASFFNGKASTGWTYEIRNVRIGKDVPPLPAMPKPAKNDIVVDAARSVWYRVDENWRKISKDMPTTPVNVGGGN